MATVSTAELKTRREGAKKEFDSFKPMLDEAFQYAIPMRKSTRDSGTGEKRVDQVFDSTAINSSIRFADKYQRDIWPPEQRNFALEPGPLVPEGKERKRLATGLNIVGEVCQAFFGGEWDMAFHEMALDLVAGTGAMLMNSTSQPGELWDPISVPIDELLLEMGPNNRVWGIFWGRKMTKKTMMDTWPEGDFGEDIRKLKDSDEIEINIDTVWVPKKNRWHLIVWSPKKQADKRIFKSESRTCPWLTPRYVRVPGETWGRGIAMFAMPEIKTLNTAKRLQLQAAAIAMLGIYTAVDDGVFNPDLSPLSPGTFWKVARNGGTMGPSVTRFPDPRLDLTGLVVENMQAAVKEIMMDGAIPVEGAAVKSPTEILERVKRLASDHMGAFGRQIQEVTVPAVRRVLELAYDKGLIRDMPKIDQLLVMVKVKSPIALAREAERVQRIIQWLEMVLAVSTSLGMPGGAARIAKVEELLEEAGRALGVPEKFILNEDEKKAFDERQAAQQQAQMAMALAMGGKMPGAPA
jgi:hypothetical protein